MKIMNKSFPCISRLYTVIFLATKKSLQTFEPVKPHLREEQFVEKLEATNMTKERTFGEKSMKIFHLSFYPNLSFNDKTSNTLNTPEER